MISLARHIELLLLRHDCVIVPGLGGFIASKSEAAYSDSDEQLFLPPFRTVGFNQQLQMNDGLLVQSYMSAYETAYPSALLQMEKEVEQFVLTLELSHEATLENVGTFHKSLNGNITFTPIETGILTPSLYGLSSYSIKSLEALKKDRELAKALNISTTMTVSPKQEPQEEGKVKPIDGSSGNGVSQRWVDVSISVAAAALLFFCLSYTAMKSNNLENDTCIASVCPNETPTISKGTKAETPGEKPNATGVQNGKLATEIKADTKASNDAAQNAGLASVNQPEAERNSSGSNSDASASSNEGKYTIVLASYVSKANAEILINRLTKNGYKEANYTKTGKVSRILYSRFKSEEEAQKELITLRKETSEFKDAWVLGL